MTSKSTTTGKQQNLPKEARRWYLVTNHLNMMYMLAAGLVMSPAGFRGKHYKDSLSQFPGQVPLFADDKDIPTDILDLATSERSHLVACIATFDLNGLHGPVSLLKKTGKIQSVKLQPKRRNKNDIAMLVPAPLPLSTLRGICFQSSEDMQVFETAALSVSNVGSFSHLINVSECLFKQDKETSSVSRQPSLPGDASDASPTFGLALGGVLTMLYHVANRSDLGMNIFGLVTRCSGEKDSELDIHDPILAELPRWMNGMGVAEGANDRVSLFWGVVQSLIESKEKDRSQSPIDVVLTTLTLQLGSLNNDAYVPRLESLIADIRALSGLGGKRISELLRDHKGSLSRPLLLMCLHEHCQDLLEFSDPSVSDTEYILAAILLGVRDSWLQLPTQLRVPELSDHVVHRMASAEYAKRAEVFSMDTPLAPVPLRKYFRPNEGEWTGYQNDQAVHLAKTCQWHDCLRTIVTLPKGEWPEEFQRSDFQLVLPGNLTIAEEVDQDRFLVRLGEWPPADPVAVAYVREMFQSQQEEMIVHADDSQSTTSHE